MKDEYLFLSPEWVHQATRAIQAARSTDKNFGKLAQSFSMSLIYVVTELPQCLREVHGGPQLVVLVQLDKGTVRRLWLGTDVPGDKHDFIVSSSYSLAKQIFCGEGNPATAFIDRKFKVEPMSRVYQRPRFTAKAIVTGNAMLKVARRVATVFPPDGGPRVATSAL
jgi:putative sterol carrier protein